MWQSLRGTTSPRVPGFPTLVDDRGKHFRPSFQGHWMLKPEKGKTSQSGETFEVKSRAFISILI